ncbi:MAG: TetR/AcrR family transcriptional regulator [Pseudomonadota bacterium]
MSPDDNKPTRGRPRTFDRSHVLDVAMQAYWQDGVADVSVNAICQRAKVSKPSLYKEFGNEDGLKQAVLRDYHAMALAPLFELLDRDQPFDAALEALLTYILRDHAALGMPNGCLFVDMCQCRDQLGALTGGQVDAFRQLSLERYEAWIDRAKAAGQYTSPIPSKTAALYIDAQIAAIMNMQRQGVPADQIDRVFRLALSVLRPA